MGTILAFVDGVGAGRRDPLVNPLAAQESLLSFFDDGGRPELPREGRAALVDACLGVEGRPQSATGQTTIFTGVNGSQALGKHLLGFPNKALREILSQHSIFKGLAVAGLTSTFANAYPTGYLEALGLPFTPTAAPEPKLPEKVKRFLRASASTCAAVAGGVALRNFDQLREGLAVTHDLTSAGAQKRGYDLPPRTPLESAGVVLRLMKTHDFVLMEHFLLDELGHARDLAACERVLGEYDAFLRSLVHGLGPDDHLLVVSDHGNVEDLSTRSHTRNPVPFLVFGPRADAIAGRVRSLVDVRAAVFLACGAVDPAPPPEVKS